MPSIADLGRWSAALLFGLMLLLLLLIAAWLLRAVVPVAPAVILSATATENARRRGRLIGVAIRRRCSGRRSTTNAPMKGS